MAQQRTKTPPSKLTAHLKTDADKKKFINQAKNAVEVLDKVLEICYNKSITQKINLDDYDSPSWSHKQAHLNGEEALYLRIQEIVDTLRDVKT